MYKQNAINAINAILEEVESLRPLLAEVEALPDNADVETYLDKIERVSGKVVSVKHRAFKGNRQTECKCYSGREATYFY